MDAELLSVAILLLCVGIWLIWESAQFYSCQLRQKAHIYLIEGTIPAYTAAAYGTGPIGVGILIVAIAMFLRLSSDTNLFILSYVSGPFFLIGFILTIWQPRQLTPEWLVWIKEYNYDIRSLLAKEARGSSNWTQLIRSETDLQNWVKEVREKHYEPQPLESFTEAMQRFHSDLPPADAENTNTPSASHRRFGNKWFVGLGIAFLGLLLWLVNREKL